MKDYVTYHFKKIDQWNMCHADASHQKVLGKRLNHSQGRKPSKEKGITTTIVKMLKIAGWYFPTPCLCLIL